MGTDHAIATSSGTSALHTALHALGVGPDDEVILPAITFFACASMVSACGGTPVVVDVGEDYNMDPERASAALTPATKAIMPVHMYGQSADMGALRDLTEDGEVSLLEDACQAHGARCDGAPVGSLGTAGCFSFYPSKVITTGEGGMVTTDEEEIAASCRLFRNHGSASKYQHDTPGYNYRMTEMAAAIGIEQLEKIDAFIEARGRNAAYLTKVVEEIDGLAAPLALPGRTHVFYQYIVRVDEGFPLTRDEAVKRLRERGVEARPSYPMPLHRQRAFRGMGRGEPTPVAEAILPRMFEIPVHPSLTSSELDTVAGALASLRGPR